MLFKKSKQKLEDKKEKCINELLEFNENLIDTIIRKLLEIQDIQTSGISEGEKNMHRNRIINTTVKELLEDEKKIKELSTKTANLYR